MGFGYSIDSFRTSDPKILIIVFKDMQNPVVMESVGGAQVVNLSLLDSRKVGIGTNPECFFVTDHSIVL
jgi:hypothetical protein